MRVENFMNFSMVAGFFIGVFFAFFNFESVIEIIFATILVNFIVYAVVTYAASLFMKYFEFQQKTFAKKSYDDILDYYVNEIKLKDRKLNEVMTMIGELNLEDEITKIKAEEAIEKARAEEEKKYR
jgi:ABC-type uncharacterized transport system permease subunit